MTRVLADIGPLPESGESASSFAARVNRCIPPVRSSTRPRLAPDVSV